MKAKRFAARNETMKGRIMAIDTSDTHSMKTAFLHGTAILVCAALSFTGFGADNAKMTNGLSDALARRILPAGTETVAHDVILRELKEADKAADDAWRKLGSREEYDAYRAKVRSRYIEAVGGLSFDRSPLNAKVVEKIVRDGYRIEKILFESRPGVYVTALLFLPDEAKFKPPYKGIILSCGHARDGKAPADYQRGAVLGALAGFGVLIYDPIAQGEREQVPGGLCCGPHNRYGALAALLGQSTAQQLIWDGMRCIDYLYSRDDICKDGVGCMGNSGGGTMTSLIGAADPRVVASCPSCWISSLCEVCAAIGPQDAEQNVFGQLTFGLNHAGYVLLGDNAVRLHCCFEDYFPISGSRETYSVVADTARNCGLDVRRYGITDVPGPHGWKESTRTSSVQWMRRWLAQNESAPDIDVEACRQLDIGFDSAKVDCGLGNTKGSASQSNVTPRGKVSKMPGFRSIYDFLKDDLAAAEMRRPALDAEALAKKVCECAAIRSLSETGASVRESCKSESLADGTTVVREICSFADGRMVPVVTFVPKIGAKGAMLILDDRPDRRIHAWRVNDALKKGCAVAVADLSCIGETGKLTHDFYGNKNADEGPAVMLYTLGRSMVGVRAEETIALADSLRRRTGFKVEVVAHGRTCIPAVHARAARRDLISRVVCLRAPKSWAESVRKADRVPFANVVNGALLHYDWTDLVADEIL